MAASENGKVVDPGSKLGQRLLKMLEDKRWFNAYLRGEITREELEAKGIKLVNPLKLSSNRRPGLSLYQ